MGKEDFVIEDGVLVKYVGSEERVVVPDSVTRIGKEAFGRCENVKSIILPDTVTSIEEWAFSECHYLTDISIPDGIMSLGDCAFWHCNRLKRTVFDNAEYIGSPENPYLILLRAKNDGITTCAVHERTKIICYEAFLKCYELESVTMPLSLTRIGESAFMWCENLNSITIPDTVTYIGKSAFCGCEKFTSIVIPAAVDEIGPEFILECKGLESVTVDSRNKAYHSAGNCIIETSSKTLIAGCDKSVIPSDGSITAIGEGALRNCDGIESIALPDTVTSIGEGAFGFMNGLKSVALPASVKSIAADAFWASENIESITVDDRNKVYRSAGNCLIERATKTLIAARAHSEIPTDGSVMCIGVRAFGASNNITSFTVPPVITDIGELAFGYCFKLKSIKIPLSVTSIGEGAFEECDNLHDIYYEGTVKEWEKIELHEDWLYNTFNVTVHCSDDEIEYY